MTKPIPIAPLTKVKLSVQAVPEFPETTTSSERFTFPFICGLAIEGLTAFEQELQGMVPGDRIELFVEPPNIGQYLEHLARPLLAAVPTEPPFKLIIEVMSVAPVSDRELVSALAQKTEAGESSCDCGGGCGCG